MRILFCERTDGRQDTLPGSSPDAEFLTGEATPEEMAQGRDAAEELERIKRDNRLPVILSGVSKVFMFIALILGASILRALARGEVTPLQAYHNAPAIFWICGVSLILMLILRIIANARNRKILESENTTAAIDQLGETGKSIRATLGIPLNTSKVDVLSFVYDDSKGKIDIPSAEYLEAELFSRNGDLSIFDGVRVLTIPKREMKGISVLQTGIPAYNWNKTEAPESGRYRKYGVMSYGTLRFCCSLDMDHRSEEIKLLFPAYELDVISNLTGLPAPELPPVTLGDKVRDRKDEEADGRYSGGGAFEAGKAPKKRSDAREPIRPEFYWRLPWEDAGSWFTPYADVGFRAEHPVFYWVLTAIMLLLLIAPIGIYFAVWNSRFGSEMSGWGIAGMIGSFLIALGLINISAAWLKQYLGHIVTLICLGGGAILVALSFMLMA